MAGLIEQANREFEQSIREVCPQAYALTANEAMRLKRIDYTIFLFFDAHREYVGVSREAERDAETGEYTRPAAYYNIYNDESIALLRATFKSKRLSLGNAAKIADRVLNGKWFAIDSVVRLSNAEPWRAYISTSDGRNEPIEREACPEFYAIWDVTQDIGNAEALREALKLEAGYLYISIYEINLLKTIKLINAYTPAQPFTAPAAGFIAVKTTRESLSLAYIGRGAAEAAVFDKPTKAYNVKAATGVEIRIKGRLKGKKAEANIDKLEVQLLEKATMSGFASPVIELSLREFMERRKLNDRGTAREQFKKAINDYYETSYEAVTDAGRIKIRPLDAQADLKNGKAIFSFSQRFFEGHKNSASILYLPEGLLAIDGYNSNAYSIGRYIWDDIKRNLGNRKREGRLRILTLLEVLDLPQDDEAIKLYPSVQRQRVIEPFFEALSIAAKPEYGDFSYKVIDGNGKPITDMFFLLDSYSLFRSCLICFKANNEPEDYARLRRERYAAAEATALAKDAKVERDRATVERANRRKASGKSKG